jgi:hypothetical protein
MKIASHKQRKRLWRLAALLAADAAMFSLTDPQRVPSFMLIVGFLLLMLNIYCVILWALRLARLYGVSPAKHQRRFARTTAGLIGGLIALQSMGQLSSHDVLLVFPLVLLAYLYLTYGKNAQRPAAATVPVSADSPSSL